MTKREPVVNSQDNGEKPPRHSRNQGYPFHHRLTDLLRQNGLGGQAQGLAALCCLEMLLPTFWLQPGLKAQKAPGTDWTATSVGASHRPWWFPSGVKSAGIQNTRSMEAWQLPPRFHKICQEVWVPRQKPATAELLQKDSTRLVPRGNVGLESPERFHWGTAQYSSGNRGTALQAPQWWQSKVKRKRERCGQMC